MNKYKYPVIPDTIRVQLGNPTDEKAMTVEVPFVDYIKYVASSEIYPTWPENAIRANVYAQISLALNRIYTEWYPAQGYDFDITNVTQFDQAYNPRVGVAENVSNIVDELFNDYIVKGDSVEPFYAEYCNGTTSTCPGMSQWGTVYLAEQGLTPLQILQYYYGDDLSIVENAPVQFIEESYPGEPLKFGMRGNDIKLIQAQLNRIRRNFPAIPPIRYADGVYGVETVNAVKTFQNVFKLPETGEVDKATWYQIKEIYNAVKKLAELASEGVNVEDIEPVVITELTPGTVANEVRTLQYYLAVIGYYIPTVPSVRIDGIYGPLTETSVRAFQRTYGLPETGMVDIDTWTKMQNVYDEVIAKFTEENIDGTARPYQGYVLSLGMENSDVRSMQKYLRKIAEVDGGIPVIEVTGVFDEPTKQAVEIYQAEKGLPVQGFVGAATWEKIQTDYDRIIAEERANNQV